MQQEQIGRTTFQSLGQLVHLWAYERLGHETTHYFHAETLYRTWKTGETRKISILVPCAKTLAFQLDSRTVPTLTASFDIHCNTNM